MAYGIAEPCIGHKDLSCPSVHERQRVTQWIVLLVCPTDAIAGLPSDPQLCIDPDLCIHCGLYVSACPVGAIFPEEDLPEAWAFYADGNRAYFRRLGA